jgi:hypothetical protein
MRRELYLETLERSLLEAYRNRKGLKRAELPDFMDVVKITFSSREHIDFSLEDSDFNVRQLLKRDNTFHVP